MKITTSLALVAALINDVGLDAASAQEITGPKSAYACACPDYLGHCQGFVGSIWGDPHIQSFDQVRNSKNMMRSSC